MRVRRANAERDKQPVNQYFDRAKYFLYAYQDNPRKALKPFIRRLIVASNSPQLCTLYAFHAIKGRFEEAEHIIAGHANCAIAYAKNALQERFYLGEYWIWKLGSDGERQAYMYHWNKENPEVPFGWVGRV